MEYVIEAVISYQIYAIRLHKRPYNSLFIVNSGSCTTTKLSIVLTSCPTMTEPMLYNIVKKFIREMVKLYFGISNILLRLLINYNLKAF